MLVFVGYRTIIARYVAKWGIAQMCLCETKYQGGVSHHFGGVLTSPKEVSRDMGYRSDSIAVSRDMGPLSAPHLWGAAPGDLGTESSMTPPPREPPPVAQ